MPDFTFEQALGGLVAGIDEVGRGCLAGPVVASAFLFRSYEMSALHQDIDDSKRMSRKRRELLFERLARSTEVFWAAGASSSCEIDAHNIRRATHFAMRRALEGLAKRLGRYPDFILVDGNDFPSLPCKGRALVKGDQQSLSIASASIMAKVLRDRLMDKLARRYTVYGWERNAGYGVKKHLEGLREKGATRHHRYSFAPVRLLADLGSKTCV